MIQFIDPRGVEPSDWCDRMTLELVQFGVLPTVGGGLTWQDWGAQAIQFSQVSGRNPPNPWRYGKDEFEKWAIDFNNAIVSGD